MSTQGEDVDERGIIEGKGIIIFVARGRNYIHDLKPQDTAEQYSTEM